MRNMTEKELESMDYSILMNVVERVRKTGEKVGIMRDDGPHVLFQLYVPQHEATEELYASTTAMAEKSRIPATMIVPVVMNK